MTLTKHTANVDIKEGEKILK